MSHSVSSQSRMWASLSPIRSLRLVKARPSGERPCAMSQGMLLSCSLPAQGDGERFSWVATSSKANKLESKPRNTSTSWNSASRPHSCLSLPNTCKAELIRTDSIAFVSLLGTRGGSRGTAHWVTLKVCLVQHASLATVSCEAG